jgi:nondiscriminating aspartyl-tRNA synthetase
MAATTVQRTLSQSLSQLLEQEVLIRERQLCRLAAQETGGPAVFVIGFPLTGRPFYTAPRGGGGAAQSFDLLFRGWRLRPAAKGCIGEKHWRQHCTGRG